MKVDRRDFLKFAVGGALGTMVTPIPWQLIDESAKFSDTWAPEPPKGPSSFVNSTCRLCPGGCGVTLRLVEDKSGLKEWRAFHHKDFIKRPLPAVPLRVVKINGNPNHVINKGGLCPLGASGLQLLYGANRITTPLKRKNSKSDSKPSWEKISWDKALEIVTKKLKEIRDSGNPQTVAAILDNNKGLVSELAGRFFTAYGTPNVLAMPSQEDVEKVGLNVMHGTGGSLAYDIAGSKFVLSFGAPLLEGWGAPVYNLAVFSKWQEAGDNVLVQVEPNCSVTASKASAWLAPKPGTEAALALGMAHVIIRDGLASGSGIGAGFDRYKAMVESEYMPAKVSEITGVPREKIIQVARQFATTRPAVAVYGRGQNTMSGNLAEFMAVYSLNALVGAIGQRVMIQKEVPLKGWAALTTDAVAQKGLGEARIDGSADKGGPCRVQGLLAGLKGGSVQALFVNEANPCYALPQAQKVREAVAKIPFVVALSSYMNETAKMADIVLPVSSYLERAEDVPTPARVPFASFGLTKAALVNVQDARHTGDIILTMASTMGGSIAQSLPYSNFEALLKDKVQGIFSSRRGQVGDKAVSSMGSSDDLWNALSAGECWYEAGGSAPGGMRIDGEKMPRYEPVPWLMKVKEYPLVVTAYEDLNIANRRAVDTLPYMTKNIDNYTLVKKDLLVRVNPETGRALGIADGGSATLQTPNGYLKVRVHLDDGVMPGVVGVPLGLGHSNDDPFLDGKGGNTYQILEPVEDPMSGLAVWWGTRAELIKV